MVNVFAPYTKRRIFTDKIIEIASVENKIRERVFYIISSIFMGYGF